MPPVGVALRVILFFLAFVSFLIFKIIVFPDTAFPSGDLIRRSFSLGDLYAAKLGPCMSTRQGPDGSRMGTSQMI